MKVSIQTLGSTGDVMPFITVAKYLQGLGIDVSILAPVDFAPLISKYNIPVTSPDSFTLTEWMEEAQLRGTLKGPYEFFRDWGVMVRPLIDNIIKHCVEAASNSDIVIANSICAPARLAAAYHKLPFILNAHQPLMTPSSAAPCAMIWKPWMKNKLNRPSYIAIKLALSLMNKALAQHREALGLNEYPPLNNLSSHLGRPLHKITSISRALINAKPDDWGSDSHLMPYPSLRSPETETLPLELLDFLDTGPAPFYFGLGSMELDKRPLPIANFLQSLQERGQRAIVTKGLAETIKFDLGPHKIVGTLPHDKLFPYCAAIVHHGGAGTLDTSVRSGRPQIILPHYLDQFWHAEKLAEHGVAPPRMKNMTSEFEESANYVLSNQVQNQAVELQQRLVEDDGTQDLVEFIIALADAPRPI